MAIVLRFLLRSSNGLLKSCRTGKSLSELSSLDLECSARLVGVSGGALGGESESGVRLSECAHLTLRLLEFLSGPCSVGDSFIGSSALSLDRLFVSLCCEDRGVLEVFDPMVAREQLLLELVRAESKLFELLMSFELS